MEQEFNLRIATVEVFRNLAESIADVVPRVLTAIIVILLGLLLAKLAEKAIRTGFDRFKIDAALERIGIMQNLQKVGLQGSPGRLLSRTVYFLLILLFTQSVLRAVGLDTIANSIGAFLSYLPNLIAAFLVLLFGMIVAQFLGRAILRSSSDSGIEFAPILSRIVSSMVIFVAIIMAISQLKIDTEIIRSVVLVLLAGVAVALALSFGLGTRDVTRNIVAGFYVRKLFRVGERVEVLGEEGTLSAVTPIQALVEVADRTVAIPNRVFLEEIVRQ